MNSSKAYSINDIKVSKWLNAEESFEIPQNKVIAIHAFQMLCPGCILHGVPQANKLSQMFNGDQVQILGLHTVFEHHDAMQEVSLKTFLYEFRYKFPVGIDVSQKKSSIPLTMEKFQIRGTPSWLLFNRQGKLVANLFAQIEDAVVASMITQLVYADSLDENLILNN